MTSEKYTNRDKTLAQMECALTSGVARWSPPMPRNLAVRFARSLRISDSAEVAVAAVVVIVLMVVGVLKATRLRRRDSVVLDLAVVVVSAGAFLNPAGDLKPDPMGVSDPI